MKRIVLMVITLSLLGAGSTAASAGARYAKYDGTPCTFEFDVLASPGLGVFESTGTFTTNGETGAITCDGPVNGSQATGPGSIGYEGPYGTEDGDSCLSGGEFGGAYSITIPTAAGNEHVTGPVSGTYHPVNPVRGTVSGEFHSEHFSGTFESTPVEGDCFTRPVTKFHVKLKGVIRS